MAKRKNQKRRQPSAAAAASVVVQSKPSGRENGRRMLLFAAAIVPAAILFKAQFDATSEESTLAERSGGATTQTMPSNDEPQRQSAAVDPSQFDGVWAMNAHFTKEYDARGLHAHLRQLFDSNERAYDPARRKFRLNPETTRHKLLHDLEQFDYILHSDRVQVGTPEVFRTIIPERYRATLHRLDQAAQRGEFDEENDYYPIPFDDPIATFFNRMILTPNIHRDSGTSLLTERDWGKVEQQWLGEDVSFPHPGIVVIDNILSPEVLESVRQYLLLSTFWFESKTPKYGNYVGAYLNDGMNNELLMEIAFELHKSMPRVMRDHHLKEIWSYKYESSEAVDEERTGIHIHADDAMVNVNLWLTPDDANLDPNSGGLVVYTVKPPREWNFQKFNSNWEYVDEHLLRPSVYANVTIPYKQNRAVIFDSFLFHKTDGHRFKRGYENRRINLTFLYGAKQSVETYDGSCSFNAGQCN